MCSLSKQSGSLPQVFVLCILLLLWNTSIDYSKDSFASKVFGLSRVLGFGFCFAGEVMRTCEDHSDSCVHEAYYLAEVCHRDLGILLLLNQGSLYKTLLTGLGG